MNEREIYKTAVEVVAALAEAGLTFATAESCTGGLIAKLVTDVPGASDVFYGGVVSYANEVKMNVLGVPEATLKTVGAVSEETALFMADGARCVCGADIAVSTTGVAGPGGGTPEKPVGTVWTAISSDFYREAKLLTLPPDAGRENIRLMTAFSVLGALSSILKSQNDKYKRSTKA